MLIFSDYGLSRVPLPWQVLLFVPSERMFTILNHSIHSVPHNVDSAEQDLLNQLYHAGDYKSEFLELPFSYNAIVITKFCEPEVWEKYRGDLRLVHQTTAKGWMYTYRWSSIKDPLECWWWDVQDLCALWDVTPAHNLCPR